MRKRPDASFRNWVRGEGRGPAEQSGVVDDNVPLSPHTGSIFPELFIAGLKFFCPNFLRLGPK